MSEKLNNFWGTQKKESVTLSKEAFDRAMRCREFLWDVPDSLLNLKGGYELLNLILACLKTELKEIPVLAAMVDEAQEVIGVISGTIPNYVSRRDLIRSNEEYKAYLLSIFLETEKILDGAGPQWYLWKTMTNRRNGIGRLLAPCPECISSILPGYMFIDKNGDDIDEYEAEMQPCLKCNCKGYNIDYFEYVKAERKINSSPKETPT